MGSISWVETDAGGWVPEALGQVGNGSPRQGGDKAWDGHVGWIPGAAFLNSVFSLTLIAEWHIYWKGESRCWGYLPYLCSVIFMPRT